MTSDGELLRCYTESNFEDAFAKTTLRHLDPIYSAALGSASDGEFDDLLSQTGLEPH
jgi:hypothetical protein